MAPVQCRDQLREDSPDKFFFCILLCVNEIFNHLSKVASSAVLHVYIQILRCFEVLSMVVGDNVWMAQGAQDGKFGVKLFTFFVGHLDVIDFFPAENLGGKSV